jgi:hypothetical protein
MKMPCKLFLVACPALLMAQKAVLVPAEFPPASHPDFLLNARRRSVSGAVSVGPQPFHYGGPDTIGSTDSDCVAGYRAGGLETATGPGCGLRLERRDFNHRPKERASGRRYPQIPGPGARIPALAEPKRGLLEYPVDPCTSTILTAMASGPDRPERKIFRWYRDIPRP